MMAVGTKILLIICGIIIVLHIWGAAQPSYHNWGTQSLAYYDTSIGLLMMTAAISLFIFPVRRFYLQIFEWCVRKISKLPLPFIFLGTCTLFIILIFQFPAKGLLLGDSKLILLTTSEIPSNPQASANFRNQPLVLKALHIVEDFLNLWDIHGLKNIYLWIDLFAGLIFLITVFLFVYHLRTSPSEKIFIGLFLMAGGGSQFFFGYIENYALLYSFTAGYVVTSWLALQKKIHIFIPIIVFTILAGLHFGAIIFLPTIILLFYLSWRDNKRSVFIISSVIVGLSVLAIYLSNYGIRQLLIRIRDAFSYDFLPFFQAVHGIPYTVFSWLHFTEWLNLNLRIVPLGLLPVIVLLFLRHQKQEKKNGELIFLVSATLCGLIFTFIMNPALGMFRDWDLMASFFIPLIFLTAYLLINSIVEADRKQIIFVIAILSVFHTSFRIGVNADEEKHLQLAERMAQPLLLGTFAQRLYYDRLANAFWDRQDYSHAKIWYEHYITLDSTNPRINANLSDVYRKLNDDEGVFRMLKKSVAEGSKDPGVYTNFGVELYKRGDTLAAISMFEKALELNPQRPSAHANLGLCYLQMNNPLQAIAHLETSINLGMNQPVILRQTGDAYYAVGNYEKAINYYESYLRDQPYDTLVMKRITKIREELIIKSLKVKK